MASTETASVAPIELEDRSLFRTRAWVDGEWVESLCGETFPVIDPASGETLAEVPRMGAEDTRRAIAAAERAYPGWKGLLAKDRARILRRFADLMMENQEDLGAWGGKGDRSVPGGTIAE